MQLPRHHLAPPVVVALNELIVNQGDLVVAVLCACVDPRGFELDTLMLRDAAVTANRPWPDPTDFVEPHHDASTIPLWSFESWESGEMVPLSVDAEPETDEDQAAGAITVGGGGHESLWEHSLRLWPLPAEGDLQLHLGWAAWDVDASITVDGTALREAKVRATQLMRHPD